MTDIHDIFLTEEMVGTALKEVIDPELGVNVVDLGLIYDVAIEDGRVAIAMTLTTPGCPLHASFKSDIEATLLRAFPGLESVTVELVWTPHWRPERITPEGRAELGLH